MNKNLEAFLYMIAWAEIGPVMLAASDQGYNVLVGSLPGRLKLFPSYDDHPRKLVKLSPTLFSTAAGRYQILMRTYDYYRKLLSLSDFSPTSQDLIATQLIKERRALPSIYEGKIPEAISKVRTIWASMPSAGYGQREHRIESLIIAYRSAGGEVG